MTKKQLELLAKDCFEATQVLAVPPELADEDVHALQTFAIYRVLRKNLMKQPAKAEEGEK